MMARLRSLHRWLGLTLAIPLILQAATGLVLVLAVPFAAVRAPHASDTRGASQTIAAIIVAAQSSAPVHLLPSRYDAGAAPGDPATVELVRPSQPGPQMRVFVDPISLTILGQQDRPGRYYRLAHELHATLLIPGPLGHDVIGWFGIGLFCLGLIGIPIWWPRDGRWQRAQTVPTTARGYRLQRRLHGAAGGWCAALLLFQSLSGASMAFPGLINAMLGVVQPRLAFEAGRHGSPLDINAVAAAAQATLPHERLSGLRFPTESGRPVFALLVPRDNPYAPPAIVAIDPSGRQAITVRDPRNRLLGSAVLAWLRALHSGDGLGPPSRAAATLSGIVLLLFPLTGSAMWLIRRQRRLRSVIQPTIQGVSK